MRPLTEKDITSSVVNASLRERNAIIPPNDLAEIDWDKRDYLGWRDVKTPAIGYLVTHIDDEPVGVLLRQSGDKPGARAQCSWCEDVTLPNDVVLFSARRSGKAGRNGDTIATLACAHFECSRNVRVLPPSAYLGFDREAARQHRIEVLRSRIDSFVRDIARDA
ncbi:treble-clef zinc-finger protein [Labedella gwakjiensis]|uniref:FBP domain-containing protein n=1 Tax=Labedella gwakjiensis TaxID=390269 RepID=A0A2P8GTC2_9MICO|nr:FBP domain-containing protein [Labedella gwakjiensis]PSL37211.1 treble-clef zinc-finger protein [Labedella gwakjiensis]RUQ84547.1 FBP domain-containing protein [Labedella gwakjiensis]